jgi:hypothetical protein
LKILEIFAVKVAQPELVTATSRCDSALSAPARVLPRGAIVPRRPGPPRRRACRGAHAKATRASSGLEARARPCVDHATRAMPAPLPALTPAGILRACRGQAPFSHLLSLKRSEAGYKGPPRSPPHVSTRSSVHRVVSLCSASCHHRRCEGAAIFGHYHYKSTPQRPPPSIALHRPKPHRDWTPSGRRRLTPPRASLPVVPTSNCNSNRPLANASSFPATSPAKHGGEPTGIRPPAAVGRGQGPHCKTSTLPKGQSVNRGHICKESKHPGTSLHISLLNSVCV